jgi:hypothetical protein
MIDSYFNLDLGPLDHQIYIWSAPRSAIMAGNEVQLW